MAEKKSVTIEENFKEMEELIHVMDEEEISLEESFSLYEKGMKLLKDTKEKIDTVEKKVLMLQKDNSLTEFDEES